MRRQPRCSVPLAPWGDQPGSWRGPRVAWSTGGRRTGSGPGVDSVAAAEPPDGKERRLTRAATRDFAVERSYISIRQRCAAHARDRKAAAAAPLTVPPARLAKQTQLSYGDANTRESPGSQDDPDRDHPPRGQRLMSWAHVMVTHDGRAGEEGSAPHLTRTWSPRSSGRSCSRPS